MILRLYGANVTKRFSRFRLAAFRNGSLGKSPGLVRRLRWGTRMVACYSFFGGYDCPAGSRTFREPPIDYANERPVGTILVVNRKEL